MPDFLLPDLGEGLDEAVVVAWRVAVGDTVAIDQVVVEVETAKAAVEVPVPFAGRVATLHAQPGEPVAVGRPLLTVDGDRPTATGFREPGVATSADARDGARDGAYGADEGSGNVLIGYGTTVTPRRARRHGPAGSAGSAGSDRAVVGTPPPDSDVAQRPVGGPVAVISPLVRKLARDAGIDLTRVHGTGRSGLVRRTDIEHARSADEASATPVPKVVADKLVRSRREIPEATVWVDADATAFLAARRAMNAADPQRPVSVLALLARFVVLGLARFPQLNARIESGALRVADEVHLGFAAQTDRGLVVPVVPGAQRLSTRALSSALHTRTESARAGTLRASDLTGGTITVNNYGVFGVDGSAAIINHPEVAIVGMGRLIERPWVLDGALAVRTVTELTLAFDHRACDGGVAGGFLRYLADCIENPLLALGDA